MDRRWRTTYAWLAVAAIALIINGIAVTTLLANDAKTGGPTGVSGVYDDARAASALSLATEQVLGVVSLDSTSGEPELAVLLDRTAAIFYTDFNVFAEDFLTQVREQGLEARSRIAAAGVSELLDNQATVIVATSGEAFDAADPRPRSRDFQMRVRLQWIDEHWRINDMDFV